MWRPASARNGSMDRWIDGSILFADHDELRTHVARASIVDRQRASDFELTGFVGAEPEGCRLAGFGAPVDPVVVVADGKAVRDIFRAEHDIHQVVLLDPD